MDEVFKALNDPSRRLLLDLLFEQDGRTLGELCEHFPDMTRFGVMNHLRVLEAADLVVTRKVGRSKHHYLNPVPIRLVHDRWISKYREPAASTLARLKAHLEGGARTMTRPDHVYQAYVRCDPAAAWNAIVDGDMTVQYFYETRVESEWEPGKPVRYLAPDGSVVASGEVISIDHGKRVEMTFLAHWDPEIEAEGPVRTTWEVAEENGLTRITVEYFGMPEGSKTHETFTSGIPYIVSGMKTLLETGAPLG